MNALTIEIVKQAVSVAGALLTNAVRAGALTPEEADAMWQTAQTNWRTAFEAWNRDNQP